MGDMKNSKRMTAAAIAAALLAACGGTPEETGRGAGEAAQRPVTVVTDVVQSREIADSIEALGTARANESVTITANLTETVRKVHFEDGQQVSEGDVLVELTLRF